MGSMHALRSNEFSSGVGINQTRDTLVLLFKALASRFVNSSCNSGRRYRGLKSLRQLNTPTTVSFIILLLSGLCHYDKVLPLHVPIDLLRARECFDLRASPGKYDRSSDHVSSSIL